jgi:xanthine/uracil permease
MIKTIQSNLDYPIIRIVNNVFSLFGNPVIVSLLMTVEICVVKHKFKALIHISFFLLGLYVIAFMKLAYQQSRPIWSWN